MSQNQVFFLPGTSMKKLIETLVFGGGGICGMSYIGALKYLYELKESGKLKIEIKEVCGVSVGTIFGLFYMLGYTAEEMENEIIEKDLEKLKKFSFMNFWGNWGLDTGENIIVWLESLLLRKFECNRKLTFSELYSKVPIKFNVLAGNLNRYVFEEFNHVKTPDVPVLDAIRMSIGIPIVFTKKIYNGDTILDGGIISSYPIDLYSDKLETTLGFKSVSRGEHNETVYNKIDSIETFLYNLFSCFMVQRDKIILMGTDFEKHTVKLNASFDDSLKFKLTKEEKKAMIDMGYITTKEAFEKNWDVIIDASENVME
jgi:predicted acylesterase/phospholipase RssA